MSKSKFRCIHISDVHFRGLSRHEEYRESFNNFFEKAKKLEPNIIFVGGDIVHSKTQGISPELIDIVSWWFNELASIAPTHIILGNHDGLISNIRRQDAISPIITALNNKNLHLHKYSGTYDTGIPGFNWGVFSCFDEDWKKVKPVPGEINIACYHGSVRGSTTDSDWALESDVPLEFFDDYDFVFLGDIHKCQYLNKEKTIAYPGSSIQQDFGETPNKGFLYWEIDSKNQFKSRHIKILHKNPYVTIDWKDNVPDTLLEAEKYPDRSRFRIKSKNNISPAAWDQLVNGLKESKSALEIVEKFSTNDNLQETYRPKIDNQNLRDLGALQKLFAGYYKDQDLNDDVLSDLDKLTSEIYSMVPPPDSIRNVYWKLKRLEFSNTFSYGENNIVDFNKLRGTVGIFGRNASGKSSIPGTIMYSLFNTTDRGAMKNLHVINTRKNYCLTNVDIEVGGQDYRVERQSVRHSRRSGEEHAVTNLNLHKINSDGELIDLAGEQRRDTERDLRNLIGSPEDFLLTAFASQGDMNNFIKKKATARKLTLTNFLDLKIFEEMNSIANDKKIELKGEMQSSSKRDWDTVLSEKESERYRYKQEKINAENELLDLNKELNDIEFNLRKNDASNIVTPIDVENKQREINDLQTKIKELTKKSENTLINWRSKKDNLGSLDSVLKSIDIDALRKSLKSQIDLEKSLQLLEFELNEEKRELERKEYMVQKLSDVPCGDKFPMCKYIIDAHTAKGERSKIKKIIESISVKVDVTKSAVDELIDKKIEEKIKKYDAIDIKSKQLKIDLDKCQNELSFLTGNLDLLKNQVIHENEKLAILNASVTNVDIADNILKLKENQSNLRKKISKLDGTRMSSASMIGRLNGEISSLQTQKVKFDELNARWNVLQLFLQATSKNGAPLSILMQELPKVNHEIENILRGVIGFTVELEADPHSNAMDIYINYGDSRRIIECASGMEKMMASLAIRVALMNVSCLPKPDILIIDEGFGTLDEMNIEACNRLLKSLKKWFKSILIISHIDAVKDGVDHIIEITKSGKDAQIAEKQN